MIKLINRGNVLLFYRRVVLIGLWGTMPVRDLEITESLDNFEETVKCKKIFSVAV